ncbi:MAG TPA: aerial mycelium formation protein [Actinomycetes bacterium]
MSEPIAGGRRRVDRVLGEGFLDDLESLSLQELRERRHDAEQEDADLSYIRRLLQGRLDIIRAERERRAKAAGDKVVDHLSEVLGDGTRSTHGSGRFLHVEPSRVAESRRRVEQLIADPHLSDIDTLTDGEIVQAYEEIAIHEQAVSDLRHRVQVAMDTLTAEVARRYRDGRASVDELLKADGD